MTEAEELLFKQGFVREKDENYEGITLYRYVKPIGITEYEMEVLFDEATKEITFKENLSLSGDKTISIDTLIAVTKRAKELGFVQEET